jgi:hypothetical protein
MLNTKRFVANKHISEYIDMVYTSMVKIHDIIPNNHSIDYDTQIL